MHDWCTTPYILTYDLGFISRGLTGSIIAKAFPFLSNEIFYTIVASNLIVLFVLTSMLLGKIIVSSDYNNRNIIVYLSLIFCINPGSISFLFQYENYGRLDALLIIISLLICILIVKERFVFIPFLTLVGVLIHQAYIFLYFPMVLVLLAYQYARNNKPQKLLFIIVTTSVSTSILFLYMQLFGKISSFSLDTVFNILSNRTDAKLSIKMLEFEYFLPISEHLKQLLLPSFLELILRLGVTLILISPLIYMLRMIWMDTIKGAKNRWMKNIYIAMSLQFLWTLPLFILTIDWGRWLAAIIICEFVLIFFLIYLKDESMMNSIKKLNRKFEDNTIAFLFILCALGAIGKFETAGLVKTAMKLVYIIMNINSFF